MFINPATGQPYSFPTAVTSGLSVGVPGTLATWQRALDRWGRFNLARDLQPAINVADQGFVVDATFREFTRENQSRFAQFTSTRDLFLSNTVRMHRRRLDFRNPDLAHTIAGMARWHSTVRRPDRRRHRGRRPQPAARGGRDLTPIPGR
jgi:gamma-glutamyltranspeptidase/glutathione hydrolase